MSTRTHGPVGYLGIDTSETLPRRIATAGFQVKDLPLPLMAVAGPGDGHSTQRIVGRIHEVTIVDGVVTIDGVSTLAPGSYSCGMDLDKVTGTFITPKGEHLTADQAFELLDSDHELVELIEGGRLIAVTAYVGPGRDPAFPAARLTVEQP